MKGHSMSLAIRLSALALMTFFALPAQAAEKYSFDPAHTMVNWQANHFGFSNPSGKFPLVTGVLVLDEKNPANSKVDVTIDILKLTTGDVRFDTHLKSKDFFDVKKYTSATFVSNKVEVTGKDKAKVSGTLILMGQSKPIVLDVVLNKIGENVLSKKKTAGFSATAMLRRSDFGISYALPGVSDEVTLHIEAEANLQDK
jgi:polyisoprenoid-binding protein YceI